MQRLFGTNYSVNWVLAAAYRQTENFQEECKTLMDIVPANQQDIDLLHRAVETAAFAGDVDSLEQLRVIAARESQPFFLYLDGTLAYLKGQDDYPIHFQKSVKSYFYPEGGESPEFSDNSMVGLMKGAIKSGSQIPEFVRMAYNIRDQASVDKLMASDNRSRVLSWQPSDLVGTLSHPPGPNEPVVLISCSYGYLKVFADYYIRIFRRKNQNIVHFHVLAEDIGPARDYLLALTEKHSSICYSIELISGESQTYFTLARFLICADVIKHYHRDVLISDIDFHPDLDLNSIGKNLRAQGYDFGLCDPGYSVPWSKFAVGFSYFRVANPATEVYLDLLSRHLASLYADGGFFSMDQIGALLIYEYMLARGYKFKMLNLYGVIDFKGLCSTPRYLQRGKIDCKFADGGPQ